VPRNFFSLNLRGPLDFLLLLHQASGSLSGDRCVWFSPAADTFVLALRPVNRPGLAFYSYFSLSTVGLPPVWACFLCSPRFTIFLPRGFFFHSPTPPFGFPTFFSSKPFPPRFQQALSCQDCSSPPRGVARLCGAAVLFANLWWSRFLPF